jgi:hypothetical protein
VLTRCIAQIKTTNLPLPKVAIHPGSANSAESSGQLTFSDVKGEITTHTYWAVLQCLSRGSSSLHLWVQQTPTYLPGFGSHLDVCKHPDEEMDEDL